MSTVNIARAVENIRSSTTVYTAIVEVIVNAIQAIEAKNEPAGVVAVKVHRSAQLETDGSLPYIQKYEITDNGVGFTDENRDSFDTLYSDFKMKDGGKGFGRFTCLKYFDRVRIESVYLKDGVYLARCFRMGNGKEIIVDEDVTPAKAADSQTTVILDHVKNDKSLDKKLETIARVLVEKLLPYFITANYICPKIMLSEADGTGELVLNDFVSNRISATVQEMVLPKATFKLGPEDAQQLFTVRLFKFFFPKGLKSRVSLVAHKREVSSSVLHDYIPEFVDDFFESAVTNDGSPGRTYIVKAYVFSPFLDAHVSLEREGFDLASGGNYLFGIGEMDIEAAAAEIARAALSADVKARQLKKQKHVQAYVDEEAPWHKKLLPSIDLTNMPYHPSPEDIELRLQKEKYRQESQIRRDVTQILSSGKLDDVKINAAKLVEAISESSRNDLVHYIALRRNVIDIFKKSLERDEEGNYESEGLVHDIIFPRRCNTEITSFDDHNLWILDERLNFTSYVSSDLPLNGGLSQRPDLAFYDKRVLFRGDNEASNPITIFEFKKPWRDDFVDGSSKEDPVQQIIRYVNSIRDGKFKTPKGRQMLVASNTPFYGYVVCDITAKVERWLELEKDFKPMPDRSGWFKWVDNINLYVEVLSWDKVLRDARLRNSIFFQKLGI